MSDDPLAFIRAPVTWETHDTAAAQATLANTLELAERRRLDLGARRFQPTDALVAAMNAAIASRSPLLLTGDPGTGKTTAAYFIAEYFGLNQPLHFQVRSDSSARDLRYDFDAVAYLQDANARAIKRPADGSDPRAQPRYLTKGKLWQAYEQARECVLLIDEIDKAPRDFPNDLLQELSDRVFDHPFGGSPVRNQGPPPMLVITSNGERVMPDPFLRRCVCCHIEMEPKLLERILKAWDQDFADRLQPGVRDKVIPCFDKVVKRIREQGRPPGIAEFLVWLNALAVRRVPARKLDTQTLADLPDVACLVKLPEDLARLAGAAT
jgi:MoxR-like ATPase